MHNSTRISASFALAHFPLFTCSLLPGCSPVHHNNFFLIPTSPVLLFHTNIHLLLSLHCIKALILLAAICNSTALHPSHCTTFARLPSSSIQHTSNMASWETEGGATAASVAESNGFGETPADTTAAATTNGDAFDMTSIAGVLSEADKAAHRDRARDAGWVETVPVDYNVQQSSRDDDHANYLKNSAVYEWDDEYGDVGPEVPELEQDLFGGDFRVRQGQHMDKLQFEVTVEGPDRLQPARSVSDLDLTSLFHFARC
jgi:hypothetical protein